jgi:putative ABC transport system permease protein
VNDQVTASFLSSDGQSRTKVFVVAGILTTGGPEDSQIVAQLGDVQDLGDLRGRLTAVAVSAAGESEDVERFANEIGATLTGVRANLVRQIAESEGRLLSKLRLMMLLIAMIILGAAGLSISTTLTALVLERRPEIGTMKALGAGESSVLRLFLCELAVLGLAGGVIGYALGIALAQPIGHSLFNSAVSPRLMVVIAVIAISLAVALLSGLIPIRRIREIEPATVLKGE